MTENMLIKMENLNEDMTYCRAMLPRVSRTFAPTILMLPEALEKPVTVAYLLCRIADTVEDTERLKLNDKRLLLEKFINIFKINEQNLPAFLNAIADFPSECADDELVHNIERVMSVFYSFPEKAQKHIGFWVVEMSRGMSKFAQAGGLKKLAFLRSMKDLDEYMYYVAGTVGYLLTALFSSYSQKITPPLQKRLTKLAESFGKGLQLVNIIRDMTTDLRRGQSYIPEELLLKYELDRKTIFEKQNAPQAEKLFIELVDRAVAHLDQALDYILLIPKEEKGIRLFCMLPVFWAMRTLQKIQENTLALLGNEKVKVSRKMIKKEYYLAMINAYSNRLTRWHYKRIKRAFNAAMPLPIESGL